MEIFKDILNWWYMTNHGLIIGCYSGVIIGMVCLIVMSWYDHFPEDNILCGVFGSIVVGGGVGIVLSLLGPFLLPLTIVVGLAWGVNILGKANREKKSDN